jgi:hypothetical protein
VLRSRSCLARDVFLFSVILVLTCIFMHTPPRAWFR